MESSLHFSFDVKTMKTNKNTNNPPNACTIVNSTNDSYDKLQDFQATAHRGRTKVQKKRLIKIVRPLILDLNMISLLIIKLLSMRMLMSLDKEMLEIVNRYKRRV